MIPIQNITIKRKIASNTIKPTKAKTSPVFKMKAMIKAPVNATIVVILSDLMTLLNYITLMETIKTIRCTTLLHYIATVISIKRYTQK